MTLLVLTYAVVFVVGPLLFFTLIQRAPSLRQFRALAAIAAACLALALAMRFSLAAWGREPVQTLIGMALMWAAWIAILSLLVQRLRAYDPGPAMRRWSAILGAICTTVPWFGLASAQFVTG